MKNRFSVIGKHTARAFCIVVACGLIGSCKDEYKLDDEKPEWLNSSVYESLQAKGVFNNYLRLLGDPDVNPTGARPLTEVLSRTGSKTVFAANDQAWAQFFQDNAKLPETNPWHNATSYERLTEAQKKLLIHGSMLNNAIVMENLASADGSGSNAPERGMYMRRFTDIMLTDSVTYMPAEEVPYTYNDADMNYWRRFRPERGGQGLYLVKDSTLNMMLHFTTEHMSKQGITDDDFRKFMGRNRATSDVHIYDALLLEKDGVCENGYVNVTEKVLAPLPNMAEAIRTNGKTKIFSHMLDRFSYPYYNDYVTQAYRTLHPEFVGGIKDSIFTLKYFAQLGAGGREQLRGPDGQKFQDANGEVSLKFDPGWNEFYLSKDRRADMAAMFVPNDETLMQYFSEGGSGWQLIQTYCKDPFAPVNSLDDLYRKIDDIPLSTLQALINVIMFNTFTGSVPSKMTSLRNDANEEMFDPTDAKLVADGGHIDTCIMACNGAVYIMDKVYGPADYTSVAAPAYISKTNLIMKWAIYQGQSSKESDQMHLNYFAYLKAMKSRFTFFLPSDHALLRYYDPVSFTSQHPRVIRMNYTGKGSLPIAVGRVLHLYDPETGEIAEDAFRMDQLSDKELLNRLKDILESHTIVMDDATPITQGENEYYLAKNGAGIKLTRENGTITKVQGGFQLENLRHDATVGGCTHANYMHESESDTTGLHHVVITASNVHDMTRDGNGMTFVLDEAPIIPASKSIYGIINNTTGEFKDYTNAFFNLTDMTSNEDIIKACGLTVDQVAVWLGPKQAGGVDYNVKFFNNFNYTVLVPTDEAIAEAEAKGLPTWDSIREDYESLPSEKERAVYSEEKEKWYILNDRTENDTIWLSGDLEEELPKLLYSDSLRLQAKITYLNNFVRCHFLDSSVFADKGEMAPSDYITSSYDIQNGVFVRVHISRVKQGGETLLCVQDDVRDQNGQLVSPVYTVTGDLKNIMARDMTCILDPSGNMSGAKTTPTGRSTMNNIVLMSSSFAVIHQINGVMNHTALVNGRYDSEWATTGSCKKYLKKHALPTNDFILKKKEQLHQLLRK